MLEINKSISSPEWEKFIEGSSGMEHERLMMTPSRNKHNL